MIIPRPCQPAVLNFIHDAPAGRHLGERRSVSELERAPVFLEPISQRHEGPQ